MNSVQFSINPSIFHGRTTPEKGSIEGYAAIINAYDLKVPIPDTISLISAKNRKYYKDGWNVLTPKYKPENTLYKQLIFAFKYEGINLLLLKKLFEKLQKIEILKLIQIEPTGQYSRKIWFLYEWLLNKTLSIPNANTKIKYTPLLDKKLQYTLENGEKSSRHRIINNLPGTADFCPLIYKTEILEQYINSNLSKRKRTYLKTIGADVLQRASAFLLLKDSKASFTIEGETPANNRAVRWGKAIGQAGTKSISKEELERLQQIVIENSRFTKMGFRTEAGFVGEHDRTTGEPIPEHISAKWQDLEQLIDGLTEAYQKMELANFDAVLTATKIAFGFVFIHPFEDGNGRIHRYLIHHILAKMKFAQQGIIFPVSASILNNITDYKNILESYSHPLLDFIDWQQIKKNNIKVLNNTIDYYRYFDATKHAQFLYSCVKDTIEEIIPNEVNYLQKYDEMKRYLDNNFEMPDKTVALLIRFLEQNKGKISKRAKTKEFSELIAEEIDEIEKVYNEIFLEN